MDNDAPRLMVGVGGNIIYVTYGTFQLMFMPTQARDLAEKLVSAATQAEQSPKHTYWARRVQQPRVTGVIASTNEPGLEAALASWRDQSVKDFLLYVVVDCIEEATWKVLEPYKADPRFVLVASPVLQGLTRVWNMALGARGSLFTVLGSAESPVPPQYLETCINVLTENPDAGWVTPTVEGRDGFDLCWNYVLTAKLRDEVGLLDPAFGLGGIGALSDWFIRAQRAGFKPRRLRSLTVKHGNYSIMDKLDVTRIEAWDVFDAKYGVDAHTRMSEFFRNPEPLGSETRPPDPPPRPPGPDGGS